MNSAALVSCIPSLIFWQYWERKMKFLLYKDIYRHWVIFAVEEGSFYYEINSVKGTASPGDLVLCPPETAFCRIVMSQLTFFVIRLHWKTADGRELEPDGLHNIPVGKINIQDTGRLTANFEAMKRLRERFEPLDMIKGNHYLHDIWLLFCEELSADEQSAEPAQAKQSDEVTQKARSLIQKHALETISLKEIASSLGISAVQLTKKFKTAYDVTPIQYLTSIRLNKAKKLLLETNMTLEKISECCGYQNGYYLNRIFMKHLNVTPTQFRKTHRV
ncbi:helix-turn-helix domain-containing protein [Paenibacillus ginsengarvi]|uniref:AraC family transcriptional regulator n=1 Tax=Paenibacillus ginsengarvi TaxID=400777 RepID=A0A3B0BUV0_9BACL|nr:AraC family transcriptional regulator [Paenibacillus ginsengarvi]RKN75787.1 AraC family transcriptional regulator [Paenibacillus ginsengarvi]